MVMVMVMVMVKVLVKINYLMLYFVSKCKNITFLNINNQNSKNLFEPQPQLYHHAAHLKCCICMVMFMVDETPQVKNTPFFKSPCYPKNIDKTPVDKTPIW